MPETVTVVDEAPTVITNDGGAVELQQPAINADGEYVASTERIPSPMALETYIVGDVTTPVTSMGETIVYEPPSPVTVSGETAPLAPAPTTTRVRDNDHDERHSQRGRRSRSSTDATFTETTTTVIEMNHGNGRALGLSGRYSWSS